VKESDRLEELYVGGITILKFILKIFVGGCDPEVDSYGNSNELSGTVICCIYPG
jgi:hypothetical protein